MFHDNNRDSEVWLCFMTTIGTVRSVFHDNNRDSEVWLCFMTTIGTVRSGCVS